MILPAIEGTDIAALGEVECVAVALKRICDVKEPAPGLEVFKFTPAKALELLRAKVAALTAPTTFATFPALERSLAKDGLASGIDQAGADETLLSREYFEQNLLSCWGYPLLTEARVKTTCEVVSQYLSPLWKEKLLASYDLSRLDAHLKALADEAQAVITRADSDPKLKDATNAPNKKPKKGSFGVEKLKKANVAGMAKLSSFFTKKA